MNEPTMEPPSQPDWRIASASIPAPTAWPVVLAFGVTLIFAGLVTIEYVTVLGALLSAVAAAGWRRSASRPFTSVNVVLS